MNAKRNVKRSVPVKVQPQPDLGIPWGKLLSQSSEVGHFSLLSRIVLYVHVVICCFFYLYMDFGLLNCSMILQARTIVTS